MYTRVVMKDQLIYSSWLSFVYMNVLLECFAHLNCWCDNQTVKFNVCKIVVLIINSCYYWFWWMSMIVFRLASFLDYHQNWYLIMSNYLQFEYIVARWMPTPKYTSRSIGSCIPTITWPCHMWYMCIATWSAFCRFP